MVHLTGNSERCQFVDFPRSNHPEATTDHAVHCAYSTIGRERWDGSTEIREHTTTSTKSVHLARTWMRKCSELLLTNVLITASFILSLPIVSYEEEHAGDDDAVGKWLEHCFGRLLFPSTSAFVLAMALYILAIGATMYRLRSSAMFYFCLWLCATRALTSLAHGVLESVKTFAISLVFGALFCQLCSGLASLFKPQPSIAKSAVEEPLLGNP